VEVQHLVRQSPEQARPSGTHLLVAKSPCSLGFHLRSSRLSCSLTFAAPRRHHHDKGVKYDKMGIRSILLTSNFAFATLLTNVYIGRGEIVWFDLQCWG